MRLLFVGLVTVDLVQRVARLPGIDEKVQSESVDVAAGGPATNAAVTAAALGATVTLVSAVGSHPLGDLVRADLAAHGVTLLDVTPGSPEPPPVSAVTVLASTGERTIVSRNAGTREVAVPPGGLPDADLTLVDGHHPALAVAAARAARRLLVDAGSWRPVFADVFPHAEVVACSGDFRHPAATGGLQQPGAIGSLSDPAPTDNLGQPAATGFRRPRDTREIETAADIDAATATAITRTHPAAHVVITHGPEPVRWFSPGAAGEVPVPPVTAVDTAGAGDAFHGALAVALARVAPARPDVARDAVDLPAAISYAARIAAVRVGHAGPRAWLAHLPG
ncbi:PfkB family carbohydrate kinase [Actinoplanes xinjiangensis]|uniref:PfkB family carbohydrate kinase n=1 Tax=Actinoplanes xinjiangensis TaxID=512350 RepID=UPI0034422174